ncbi:MAG: preprotein translocase subunit SecA [Clostridia bacterium]|nr:preprotein translocase subunit SecA [Clostridia bacterium]
MFKLFKSENERNVKKLEKIAALVEGKADYYKSLTDEELKETTTKLKERLANGEKLIDILPDAYALVREASDRVLGMRHFHVQILGGIALFQGRIAEMRTGEGKTLVETLPAYLIALEGKGVHIVTVNEYLSKRDAEWMGKLFTFLGLTVGVSMANMSPTDKRAAYNCDITYSTNNELGFDYLRDNMVSRKEERVCRGYHFAIVDEVDSILIDEARTPLIISGMGTKSSETYVSAAKFVKGLIADADYEIDEKDKAIRLTEDGVNKAEHFFKIENLSDITHIELNHHINNALRAQYIMKRDNNYIVKDDEIIIVDEFTGRLMEGRKYSNGLHQAIEAKEGVTIKDENKTLATITFQNFFRIYEKLSGMTGTAKTEEIEFNKIYGLDVVTIPTNRPIKRVDYPDIIYPTERAKLHNVVEEIKAVHADGRPILIGTVTIEKSEQLSQLLKQAKIRHNVLNAKNHQQESEIIAQAGRMGSVTIATNMAGRGTDILLGGNPEFLAKQKMREAGFNEAQLDFCTSFVDTDNEDLNKMRERYRKAYNEFKEVTDVEKRKVVTLGGLHIIGTERHESRRIDNQLRGRAGRQGDPGSSVFYVSMEDELVRRFGGDQMKRLVEIFKVDENTPFQFKILSKSIETAQKRIEGHNFSSRSNVLKYDDVLNSQRHIIYEQRNKVLDGENIHEDVLDMISDLAQSVVYDNISDEKSYDEWDLADLNDELNVKVFGEEYNYVTEDLVEGFDTEMLAEKVSEHAIEVYNKKCDEAIAAGFNFYGLERAYLLRVVDSLWMEHIDFMNMLRNEIVLRAYGNHDPVVAYKKEGFELFDKMIDQIRNEVPSFLLHARVDVTPPEAKKPVMFTNAGEGNGPQKSTKGLVGRNEPCPCGSGKKYKNCCGRV